MDATNLPAAPDEASQGQTPAAASGTARSARSGPHLYLNRELEQLAFTQRVFAQAQNRSYPLLERLKFLCIVSSNLDEFFEIRVAGLHAEIEAGTPAVGPDRMKPTAVFEQVAAEAHALVSAQYRLLNDELLPKLEAEGIRFLRRADFTPAQATWIRDYFLQQVMPVLTPIGLDPAHPFPRVLNKSLNFAVELEGKDAFGRNSGTAIVQAPRVLPRVIRLPTEVRRACRCDGRGRADRRARLRASRRTRPVLVPTARTACRSKPRRRSPKRCRHASARSWATSSSTLSGPRPAPSRTGSRRLSRG